MRLILKLYAKNDQIDVSKDYHKLQGVVYKLIKNSNQGYIHNKYGYKFFCFSNIFPPGDMKAGDLRNFIISSPNKNLINSLADYVSKLIDSELNFGDSSFIIKDFETFELKLPKRNIVLTTSTPIIIRIPENKYDNYGIPKNKRMNRFLYWRQDINFTAFLKQLTENIIKKYNEFYGTKIDYYELFEQFQFRQEVHLRIIIHGKSYGVVASLWDFIWSTMDNMQRQLIQFGLDTGFGERNSMGFGFVNLRSFMK